MLSTSQTCVCTRCRTSLVPTPVLHSYSLLVCSLQRRPAFARVAELLCYPLLSYIRTRCSYAVNIPDLHLCVAEPHWYLLLSYIRRCCSYAVNTADLRSHVLQRLAGTHCCSTFAPAVRLPPLLLATLVHAARLPSTSSTCMGTQCRTSLVPTAVLHPYALLLCRLHRRPAFACRASLVPTTVLHSYALLVCCLHRRPAFVRVAEPHWCPLLFYIHPCCASAAIAAGNIRTRYSSAVYIVDLRSHALQSFVATHCCPTFVRAARLLSTSSTCMDIRCRTSSLRTAVLHSYMLRVCRLCCWLQPYALLVCRLHRRPAFACRASLVPTAVLHSYGLLVCRQHRRPAWIRVVERRRYARLSYIPSCCVSAAFAAGYIRMRCSSAVYIVDLRSLAELLWYPLLSYIRTHCPYAVNIADLRSCVAEPRWYLLLSYIHTCCSYAINTADLRSHVLQGLTGSTAVLHSHLLRVCCHCRWLHPYTLLVCCLHRQPVFTCRASLVPTAVLHSYVLLICRQHRQLAWIRIAEPRCYARLSYIPTCCVSAAFAAGYIRTRCSSAVYIVDLRSYALQCFVATHCCPIFLRAACMPSTSLSCICVLQNLVGTCCSPTFVCAARMLSTPLTCVRTRCRASLVPTAVLHSHMLHVCRHYHWSHP